MLTLWFVILDGFGGGPGDGSGAQPAPSVNLTFRRNPRLFGPKRVATVDP